MSEAVTLAPEAPEAPEAPATVETVATVETNNERRHRMRIEATARHASLVQATRLDALATRADRLADGYEGREGYVAWTQDVRDRVRDALDGALVTLTVRRLHGTTRGTRVTCTGVTDAAGYTVAIRGEATVVDIADGSTLDGATVQVRLTPRTGARKNGSPFTGFTGESVGVSSTGQRIGIKAQVQASRHVRIVASAL